jgi:anti-anti-sigma factor
MELTITQLDNDTKKIDLAGRLDLEGAQAIDMKFTVLTASERTFSVIDLSRVEFMASMGIATLVRNAKAARLRAGNMVLLNPQANVAKVLTSMGIDRLIPICYSLADACSVVQAPLPPTT